MLSRLTISLTLILMLTVVTGPALAQRKVFSQTLNGDTGAVGDEIAEERFIVYQMNGTPPNGIVGDVTLITALSTTNGFDAGTEGAFPNLEELFAFGGTVELAINFGADGTGGDPDYTYAKAADVPMYRLTISEILWGTDAAADAPAAVQWIEIYNEGATLKNNDDVRLVFTENQRVERDTVTLPTSESDTEIEYVIVDRVSTINRFGRGWQPKGNSGRTAVGDRGEWVVNLVSMYRKRSLNADADGYTYNDRGEPEGDEFADGTDPDQWIASAGRINMGGAFVGSPGSVQVSEGSVTAYLKDPDSLPTTDVVINEIRNDNAEEDELDWVELHNTSRTDISIKKWRLNIITADGDDADNLPEQAILAEFPDEDYAKIPAGGYLVIIPSYPMDNILMDGVNIADSDEVPRGAIHRYFIDSRMEMANDGKALLVLRSGNDTEHHEKIVDIAGSGFFRVVNKTDVFPLRGWRVPDDFDAADFGGDVMASADQSFARKGDNKTRDNRIHEDDWEAVGTKGGIGYNPDVDLAIAPGTPGYANDAVKDRAADVEGSIVISEVMYNAGANGRLVQWIELYNSSMTDAADLTDWRLEIRNRDADDASYVDDRFRFKAGTIILPNQTLLLVSNRSRVNDVLENRVYNLYRNHRTELGLSNREYLLLSSEGFYLKLTDKGNKLVDAAGNIKVDGRKRDVMWTLPETDGEVRYSILRQFGGRNADGTRQSAWRKARNTDTYYGHDDDVGSPGYRMGGPLPVSLSSFRPVRDRKTGRVVITWVTESELNNAGFNILRSDTRGGAFEVVNLKGLIAGHGTTGERHVYTFTDTTAKPNVVYYYRIEDVSLDGKRTTLRTTYLRGNVSASGKLTTIWGDLKSRW